MWGITPQSGLATVILDFTSEFSPLLFGLLVMVGVSASAIAWMAFKYHRAQKTVPVVTPKSTPKHQEAA